MLNLYVLERDADYDQYEGFVVAAESEVSAHWVILAHLVGKEADDSVRWPQYDNQISRTPFLHAIDDWWIESPNWRQESPDKKPIITVRLIGHTDNPEPRVELAAYRAG